MDAKLKNFLVNTLRRASFRWKPRGDAEKLARVKVGEFSTGRDKFGYQCAKCGIVGKKKDTNTDHIYPVVAVTGWDSLDSFAERMFCDIDGFSILCCQCHDKKTNDEKDFRVKFRKLYKEDKSTKKLEKEYKIFVKGYKFERLI